MEKNRGFQALVVGSGAAGYAAACRLREEGVFPVALVTEGINRGTSRNTGSDKQTYYKLSLGGSRGDSVRAMAEDLFACGAVDGDNALCEAALSAPCFFSLCALGVPFPQSEYGEYVGYQTDHDEKARATSAGPLTSRYMTEALEKRARLLGIPVYDGWHAVEILKDEEGAQGILCVHQEGKLTALQAPHIIWATGGPAGIYQDSVYPDCHTGSTAPALLAGAQAQNLTHWQYGLASVSPRWNVSGSYMQALPRMVSVDAEGREREFLSEVFSGPDEALAALFLKGYQWPFDSRRTRDGSSKIDLAVYEERVKRGRRVFLDFRRNPFEMKNLQGRLSEEARTYLERAGACQDTPLKRLLALNAPAAALYRDKGVDLEKEMLEIALCAQHHNGGLAVDEWWQTCVKGLYAAGECAGTHGVRRPGGSALNAGQVGAFRAAQSVAQSPRAPIAPEAFERLAREAKARHEAFCQRVKENQTGVNELLESARRRMSAQGGPVRSLPGLKEALRQTREDAARLPSLGCADPLEAYRLRDALVCQEACLAAMADLCEKEGPSRGGALYLQEGEKRETLAENWIQQGLKTESGWEFFWRPPRPLPGEEISFESMWKKDRERRGKREEKQA